MSHSKKRSRAARKAKAYESAREMRERVVRRGWRHVSCVLLPRHDGPHVPGYVLPHANHCEVTL